MATHVRLTSSAMPRESSGRSSLCGSSRTGAGAASAVGHPRARATAYTERDRGSVRTRSRRHGALMGSTVQGPTKG